MTDRQAREYVERVMRRWGRRTPALAASFIVATLKAEYGQT